MSCFGKDCRCVRVNLSLQMQHCSVLPFCLDNHFVLSRVSSFSFTSAGYAESRRMKNLLSAECLVAEQSTLPGTVAAVHGDYCRVAR